MTTEANDRATNLTPDQAFTVLGNETRMEILQVLGESENTLSCSAFQERVGVDDPGKFNYHLNKRKGHFVRQTDDGSKIQEPGNRIIQAVLSGGVTGKAALVPTGLEAPCPYCDEPVETSYRDERLLIRCTGCAGTCAGSESDAPYVETHPHGTVAVLPLPLVGFAERTPRAVLLVHHRRRDHRRYDLLCDF